MIGADGSVRALYDKIHMFDANVGDGSATASQTISPPVTAW